MVVAFRATRAGCVPADVIRVIESVAKSDIKNLAGPVDIDVCAHAHLYDRCRHVHDRCRRA